MVDSREKGARAETVVKDELKKLTGLKWERTPGSGALHEKHNLKGDLYIPNEKNYYCVEVKHYAEDYLTSQLLSSKNPQLISWWEQAVRQAKQVEKQPLLIFKYDRSKLFAAYKDYPCEDYPHLMINTHGYEFFVSLLSDWIKMENPKFI